MLNPADMSTAAVLRPSNRMRRQKFTTEHLEFCLYGHFASQESLPATAGFPGGGTQRRKGFKFSSGMGQSIKLEPPTSLPDRLQLVGADLGRTSHQAVICTKAAIEEGTRFGPYTGKVIEPAQLVPGADYLFMWEVFQEGRLEHYIDGSTDPENWMKFVNCARHDRETNLHLVQEGDQIFYEARRDILVGEELLVWYGMSYQLHMGIPTGMKLPVPKEEAGTDYSCGRCGKVFNYKYYRDRHLKYTRCVDQGDRKFPCTLCDRSFDKRDRLRIHVLHVHEKHRPHQCKVCSKRFSQSSSLNKHMRVHSGERPYKCPFCIKAFTASSILRTHIRQHSGEKPFKCKHCGRAFASHAAHDSHVRRTHTKEKPCVCEYCGKAFAQSYELKFHINMHTGAKPYTCEKCGRAFSSPSSRDRHRANFDCTTRRNRAPKVMRKNSSPPVPPSGQDGLPHQFPVLAEKNEKADGMDC